MNNVIPIHRGGQAPLSRTWQAWYRIKNAVGLLPDAEPELTAEAVLKVVEDLHQTQRSLDNKRHEARALKRLHRIAVEQRDWLEEALDGLCRQIRWMEENAEQRTQKIISKVVKQAQEDQLEAIRKTLDEAGIPREIRRAGGRREVLTLSQRVRMLMEARDEALRTPLRGASPLPPDPIEIYRPCGWSGHVQ